jgi:mycothiol synthase
MPRPTLPTLRHADLDRELPALANLVAASQPVDGLHPPGEHQHLLWSLHEAAETCLLVLEKEGVAAGYAGLIATPQPGVWNLELGMRQEMHRSGDWGPLLEAAVSEVRNRGGNAARLWPHLPELMAAARRLGFVEERRLLRLHRSLPSTEEVEIPEGISLEHFVAGGDEAGVDEVTVEAFAGTAEQWVWTPEVMAARRNMGWFDPRDLITARDGRELLGFCWVKWGEPQRGEIYLLAVRPSAQRQGLGRALALAGLQRMARHGAGEAFLYVDDANQAALTLYQDLGFNLDHVDVALLKRW